MAGGSDTYRDERLNCLVKNLGIPRDEARILLDNLGEKNGE